MVGNTLTNKIRDITQHSGNPYLHDNRMRTNTKSLVVTAVVVNNYYNTSFISSYYKNILYNILYCDENVKNSHNNIVCLTEFMNTGIIDYCSNKN